MKFIFGILLAILIASVSVKDSVCIAVFKVNQKAIAKQFCKNVNLPTLKCNGKCFFSQKLKETKKKEKKGLLLSTEEYKTIVLFLNSVSPPTFLRDKFITIYGYHNSLSEDLLVSDISEPPEFV